MLPSEEAFEKDQGRPADRQHITEKEREINTG